MSGKFYAVLVGRLPGIYTTWSAASAQVMGYPRATYKGFATMADARAFMQRDAGGDTGSAASAVVAASVEAPASLSHSRNSSAGASASASAASLTDMPLMLFFDGGSRGNPGPAGCAAVLKAGDTVVAHTYRWLGDRATNNVAEYEGLILGLMLVKDLGAVNRLVSVRGDSLLIIRQITGKWAVRDDKMVPLHAEACRLLRETRVLPRQCEHVYRESNREADAMANVAIDTRSSESFRDEAYFSGHLPTRTVSAASSARAPLAYAPLPAGAKRRREP